MNQIVEKPKKYSLVERAPAASFEEERLHRKQRLAATFRLFSRYGFDQGLAGHVTVRDPEFPDRFWINPLSKFFGQIKVSDLQLVDHAGNILIGDKPINQAGFVIHSAIHAAHPEVIAAAHTHSTYGKAWSALGRLLDPLTQDSCAFYEDHALFDHVNTCVGIFFVDTCLGNDHVDKPPVLLRASRTTVFWPARAKYAALVSPLWPPPMMMAS